MILKIDSFENLLGVDKKDEFLIKFIDSISDEPVIDQSFLGDRIYLPFLKAGFLILIEEDRVTQITFYIEGGDGFYKCALEFPDALNGGKANVMSNLGMPSATGGGINDKLIGYINKWIKYQYRGHELHLEYDDKDNLVKITITE
ncbi:hypothetical protein ACOZ0V_003332 [Cronobacter malonaticus]|uniref:Uncharacterized protein n=3 Tax=Cronobacter malonaticus TaxID=413503 RepID=A0ABX5JXF6_9ENTR|nr:hypothetical protein [Cronobacter malonaticus]ALX80666.1 hypothetical protein AFK66_023370 [Cronobacter malonaticus LMG 23826]EGT4290191.1 hypothetical protein [Cronobacter malonaticus]EGT4315461.1 hypothetical protein [Cronobacter malonaticus]ELQ6047501.1 hypothetical protein [Cronobacter malonaticus]ELY6296500.1 hypothetical protein [Cronobacter malonaticus]